MIYLIFNEDKIKNYLEYTLEYKDDMDTYEKLFLKYYDLDYTKFMCDLQNEMNKTDIKINIERFLSKHNILIEDKAEAFVWTDRIVLIINNNFTIQFAYVSKNSFSVLIEYSISTES
ncbi:MAG: hypothetical protein ACOC56_04485 [Atribacterota bacterium]